MTLRVHPLVQACLEGRVDRVCAIVDQIPKTSHLYEPYVAIHAAVVGLLDQSNPVRAYHRLRRALSNPGSDPQILMLLVRYASLFAVRLGLSQEARRLIRIAADVAADKVPAELGAAVMLSDAALHEAKADFERAAEVCVAALDMDLKVPSRFWACLKSHRAHYAILCHDFATAEADVKAIEAHEDYRDNLREPALALRVRLCCESGRAEQGLAILDATSQEDAGIGRPRYVALGVRLLIALGRLDEATIMLDQAENEVATLSKSTAHRLRAELALAHGDMKAVRGHARDAIEAAGSNHPAEVVASLCHLASAELGHRRTVKARQILARIDPDESKMPTQIHWSRLYLQENNLDRAVEHFQRVVALGPAYVEQACRDACELKGHDLARLQTKCVAAGGDWVAAGPVRSPSPDDERTATARLVGNSTSMRQIRSRIRSYAGLSTPVLITGQTGTGKDVVARLLHLQSARAGEFIPVNCGALSDTLIESEMFGHVKGAFTGAAHDHEGLFVAAGRGTIFLDEIHAMSPRLQAALLRVLENGEVRPVGSSRFQRTWARVIAATNEPIDQLLQHKQLRSDLYYRLAKLRLDIPPLCERPEDIEPLVRHCLREMFGHLDLVVADDLIEALRRDPWPGNVRELKNDIERIALAAGESRMLTAAMFPRRRDGADERVAAWQGDAPGRAAVRPQAHRRTFDRRRRLRDMFEQYDRLYRAEVIELLGCSPNTATRDLRALEQEGAIRRVHTSAHLRTSYFVKNDRV